MLITSMTITQKVGNKIRLEPIISFRKLKNYKSSIEYRHK